MNAGTPGPEATLSTHGYGPYSKGCRCEVCRRAKADYMRDRRAAARAKPQGKVAGILHGSRAGYEEHGCRCTLCVRTRSTYGASGRRHAESPRRRYTRSDGGAE